MNILISLVAATIVAASAPAEVEQTVSLPEEFTLDIDFSTRWPFEQNWYKPSAQNLDKGDAYTYLYEYEVDGKKMSEEFKFVIYGNKKNYLYVKSSGDGNMTFRPDVKSATTRITLPAVPGKYLKSVTLKINNNYPKRFAILDSKDWKIIAESEGATSSAPATVTFSEGGVQTHQNRSYYMRLIDTSMQVTGITLVYSSSL